MKLVMISLAGILASSVVLAACTKSTQGTTTASAAPPEAAATQAATGAATAATAAAPKAALPIPLAKLPGMKVALGDATAGAKVFAANCESCHGAQGKSGGVGPVLYGVGLTADQVAFMVRKPTAIDKASTMPALPLSDKQVADVAAYVASLK